MNYKTVTGKELKHNFPVKLELDIEKTYFSMDIEKILSDEMLYFYFTEKLNGHYIHDLKKITEDNIKEICFKDVKNIIISNQDQINYYISKENNKFFKNKKKLQELYNKQSLIQSILAQSNKLESRLHLSIKSVNDSDNFIIPLKSIDVGQDVFIVSQNFNSYLDVLRYKVDKIIIVDTSQDNQYKTDFEFSYVLINEKGELLNISHDSFRSFNGNKAIINDKFLFIDIEEAKKHCILVLENLQNDILDKIEFIKAIK